MIDIFKFDTLEAFRRPGCPLCRLVDDAMRQWMDSFWREGRNAPAARRAFFAAGGFCRAHAFLLLDVAKGPRGAAAVVDVYTGLARVDLERLTQQAARLESSRRRHPTLSRASRCPACVEEAGAVERKGAFFIDTLRDPVAQDLYLASDGVCYTHLEAAFAEAIADGDAEIARFLVDDWRRRLGSVREQAAPKQIVSRYVGGQYG